MSYTVKINPLIKMDLKDFILKVFPMKDDERYSKMIDNMKRLGFDSVSDLKYLDEESIKELEAFSRIEIKRLTDHLTKFGKLLQVAAMNAY